MISIRYKSHPFNIETLRVFLYTPFYYLWFNAFPNLDWLPYALMLLSLFVGILGLRKDIQRWKKFRRKKYMLLVAEEAFVVFPGDVKEQRLPKTEAQWRLRFIGKRLEALFYGDSPVELVWDQVHPKDMAWLEKNLPQTQLDRGNTHWLAPDN